MSKIEAALLEDFFPTFPTRSPDYLDTPAGRRDLRDHLIDRLESDRRLVVPWLDDARSLDGATILEIGCGTGASTVALAEQGARVTALDVAERHLRVAQVRSDVYKLDVEFVCSNGTLAHTVVGDREFDFVLFFATLEHMTQEERLTAMSRTFDLVRPGGYWCVIEAPNRLWYFDSHTSGLPFFLWLPDDLAMMYRRFSDRKEFAEERLECQGVPAEVAFARWGRGVSFHEFDLAFGPADELDVHSSLSGFLRRHNPLRRFLEPFTSDRAYRRILERASNRDLHDGFFQPYLNLIIARR